MSSNRSSHISHKPDKQQVLLSVLFGFFWCWNWIVFESPTDLPVPIASTGYVIPSRTIALLSFFVAGCTVFAVARTRSKYREPSASNTAAVATVLCALPILIGVFDCMDGAMDGTFASAFAFPVGILFGIFGAILYIDWGSFFGSAGIGKFEFAVMSCVVSSLIAAILSACMYWLSDFARQCFVLGFPLISFLVLSRQRLRTPHIRRAAAPGTRADQSTVSPVPWKFVFSLFVLGLSLGIMQSIFTQTNTELTLRPLSAIGFAIAGCVALAAIYLLKLDFNRLMYQIGLPLIAIGFLVLALLKNPFVGYMLSIGGYRFTEIVIWILGIYLITRIPRSSYWIFALVGGITSIGQAIGLAAMDGRFEVHLFELSIIASVALLLCSLFLITSKNTQDSWGIVSPGTTASHNDSFEAACLAIVDAAMLSVREREVFSLLAQGRNKRNISSKLVLSENTIKTHIANVYQKLGVHSQQELIDLVERKQHELDSDALEV